MKYSILTVLVFVVAQAWGGPINLSSEMSPAYEGAFAVTLKCQETDPTPECHSLKAAYTMIITNFESGVAVTVVDPYFPMPKYIFEVLTLSKGGAELAGASSKTDRGFPLGEFSLKIDREHNEVLGWVRDPLFKYDLMVEGRQTFSPATLYKKTGSAPPLMLVNVIGNYRGSFAGGVEGNLNIRKSALGNSLLAVLADDVGNKIHFNISQLYAENQVVNFLTPNSMKNTFLKWTLTFSEDARGRATLKGAGYSSFFGRAYGISFVRIDE